MNKITTIPTGKTDRFGDDLTGTTIDAREGITIAELLTLEFSTLCTLQEANFIHTAPELFSGKWFSILPRQQAATIFQSSPSYACSRWRDFENINALRVRLHCWHQKTLWELIGVNSLAPLSEKILHAANLAYRLEIYMRDFPQIAHEFKQVAEYLRQAEEIFIAEKAKA